MMFRTDLPPLNLVELVRIPTDPTLDERNRAEAERKKREMRERYICHPFNCVTRKAA